MEDIFYDYFVWQFNRIPGIYRLRGSFGVSIHKHHSWAECSYSLLFSFLVPPLLLSFLLFLCSWQRLCWGRRRWGHGRCWRRGRGRRDGWRGRRGRRWRGWGAKGGRKTLIGLHFTLWTPWPLWGSVLWEWWRCDFGCFFCYVGEILFFGGGHHQCMHADIIGWLKELAVVLSESEV